MKYVLRLCGVALLWACLWNPDAFAQTPPPPDATAFQLQRFRPWGDPQGMFQTESARPLGGLWSYKAGLMLNYAYRPLAFHNPDTVGVIDHQIGANVLAGVGFSRFFELHLDIPMTLYQLGKIPNNIAFFGRELANQPLDGFYLSDIRLGLRSTFLDEKRFGISLGIHLSFGLPTATTGPEKRKNLNGEEPLSFAIRLLASKKISIVQLAANLGYRLNPETFIAGLLVNHELLFSVGASFEVVKKKLDVILDIYGSAGLTNGSIFTVPLEASLGIRYFLLDDKSLALNFGAAGPAGFGFGTPLVRVFLGLIWTRTPPKDSDGDGLFDPQDRCPKTPGPRENRGCPYGDKDGDGLKDNVDKCPNTPGPKENRGCPWPDTDGDGLKDNVDKCPNAKGPKANKGCPYGDKDGDGLKDPDDKCPEKAGPKENNGCPWPDTDGDGLHDKIDKCPTKFGPRSNQGCPRKKAPVIVLRCEIKVVPPNKVFFEYNKAILKPPFKVVEEVARILKENPKFRIRIDGHTDNTGKKDYNLKLSQRRADAVRKYLIKKGVDAGRLSTKGFGMSKPLKGNDNSTAALRAQNRRVEFLIRNNDPKCVRIRK